MTCVSSVEDGDQSLDKRPGIRHRSDQPMVHVPVEGIMSKGYGESEKKLSAIFDACDDLGGAIIFIDEVDALAGSRDKGDMHEATRRVLSVILQKVGWSLLLSYSSFVVTSHSHV